MPARLPQRIPILSQAHTELSLIERSYLKGVLVLITPTVTGNEKCPVGAEIGRTHNKDRPK